MAPTAEAVYYVPKKRNKRSASRRILDEGGEFQEGPERPRRGRKGKSSLTKLLNVRVIKKEIYTQEAMEIAGLVSTFSAKDWEEISKQLKQKDLSWRSLENGDLDMEDLVTTEVYIKEFGDEDDEKVNKAPWADYTVKEMKAYLVDQGVEIEKGTKKQELQELMKLHYKNSDEGSGDGEDFDPKF